MQAIQETLDSMFHSRAGNNTHVRHLIHRVLQETGSSVGLTTRDLQTLHYPYILKPNPLAILDENGTLTQEELEKNTRFQCGKTNIHQHGGTCCKGCNGITGCRLCRPVGFCDETHPVLLVKRDQETLDQGFPETTEGQTVGEPPTTPIWRRAVTTVRNKPVQFDYTVVDPVPEVQEVRVSLRNPLTRPKTELYVWELNRKPPEPLVSETVLSQLKSETKCDPETEKELRYTICQALQNELKGDESYPEESKLWIWLQEAPFEHVAMFFLNLVAKLYTINLDFVEHNSMISYCTGSHNNAVPLGSLE